MDNDTKKGLEAQHGDLIYAKLSGKEFAFKCPNQTDYEEFQAQMQKDRSKGVLWSRQLCLKALVEPGPDVLEQAFNRYPAAPPAIALELEKLAGSEVEIIAKKG